MGLLKTREDGNRLYFRANGGHPFFPEIRSLVEKTTGAPALLREALSDPGIRVAFIFGLTASGQEKPESDIDLFVIGDIGLRKLAKLLHGMTDRLGREVNPHVLSPEEFFQKVQKRDHFVANVIGSKKVFVIGDESELKRLGKKRLAESA